MKVGHKTTEFWVTLAAAIMIPILVAFEIMDEATAKVTVASVVAYVLSRTGVKAAEALATGKKK